MIQALVHKAPVRQFMKFLATGGLNTFIDFAILNLLIVLFGLVQGDPRYILFKAVSFIAASINSFFLNKKWVFDNGYTKSSKQIGPFIIVAILGLVVNTLVSLSIFHLGTSLFPLTNTQLMANIGAISGTVIVLLFNFLAYKFIIFK